MRDAPPSTNMIDGGVRVGGGVWLGCVLETCTRFEANVTDS